MAKKLLVDGVDENNIGDIGVKNGENSGILVATIDRRMYDYIMSDDLKFPPEEKKTKIRKMILRFKKKKVIPGGVEEAMEIKGAQAIRTNVGYAIIFEDSIFYSLEEFKKYIKYEK